jgi:hypothetical protein
LWGNLHNLGSKYHSFHQIHNIHCHTLIVVDACMLHAHHMWIYI